MQLPAVHPLNDYFAQLTPAEKEQEETKLLLLQALSLENREVLAFLMQQPQKLTEMGKRSAITNALGFPLIDDLSNNLLMGAFRALKRKRMLTISLHRILSAALTSIELQQNAYSRNGYGVFGRYRKNRQSGPIRFRLCG